MPTHPSEAHWDRSTDIPVVLVEMRPKNTTEK